jgi:hypothetical protein
MGQNWQQFLGLIRTNTVCAKLSCITSSLRNNKKVDTGEAQGKMSENPADDRLFLQVQILGNEVISLLDSGATICILGKEGQDLMRKLDLKIETCKVKNVELADKSLNTVAGKVELPITLNGKTFLITTFIVPAVDQKLILGLNFWHQTGFIPNVATGTYTLSQHTDTKMNDKISSVSADGDKLTETQREELTNLITETKKQFPHKLGRTQIYEHASLIQQTRDRLSASRFMSLRLNYRTCITG